MGFELKLLVTFLSVLVVGLALSMSRKAEESEMVGAISGLAFWVGLLGAIICGLIHIWAL